MNDKDLDNMAAEAQNLVKLASDAQFAITMLKSLQKQFMAGVISYDEIKEGGQNYVNDFNKYAKALAKARKMPYKPITLGYFMR